MKKYDVVAYCNANKKVGHGHLRRCLFLSKKLKDASLRVAFSGNLSDDATRIVKQETENAKIIDNEKEKIADIVLIDYMYDSEDPEYYDKKIIDYASRLGKKSILITSSATIPRDLPVDVVIGHLLEARQETTFELKAGLQYAPVAPELGEYRQEKSEVSEQIRRVFIGFGNWNDPQGVTKVLQGLRDYGYRSRIDILLPPALLSYVDQFKDVADEEEVHFHHQIPSVPALLVHADLAFGSYGNMTYEMIGLGVPSVVFAVKDFMVEYTRRLQDRDLLLFGGEVTEITPANVSQIVETMTESRRFTLSRKGLEAVDARGLHRVADVILDRISQRSG